MTRRCSVLKHTPIVALFLVAALMLSACAKKDKATAQLQYKSTDYRSEVETAAGMVAPAAPVVSALHFTPPALDKPEDDYAAIPKKIIKEGTIRYSVHDYKSAHKELTAIIARFGGEIISEKEGRSETAWETQLEIRVPSVKFDSCLNTLAGADETLLEKSITSEDVTEEYVDVSARMNARKAVEQRYLDILKQAKNVEDILKVEEQLKGIREEVEAAQGRLQYIDHNVSMSAIHLSFVQIFSNTTPKGPGFFSSIFFSIKDGWNHVLGALISFTGLWPVWLAVAAAIIIIRRYRKRRRARALA